MLNLSSLQCDQIFMSGNVMQERPAFCIHALHAQQTILPSLRQCSRNLFLHPGEEKCQELSPERPAKSMDFLLDTLLDMSVAALVSPSSFLASTQAVGAVTPDALPVSFRSAFDQPQVYAAHALGARLMGRLQEV